MIDHTQISKQEWLTLARSFYAHLLDVLNHITEEEWKHSTRYLGWDCKDLVNHMTSAITINFNLLVQMALNGEPVPPPGFNLFLRNANEVDRRRKNTSRETIDEFDKEITRLLTRLDSLSEDQWNMSAFFFIGDVDIRTLFLVQFADNVVHEHDLLVAAHRWKYFDPKYTAPLMDWFLRVFRPATFRPEKAGGESFLVQYIITGNVGGHWFMKVENNTCNVFQGIVQNPEATVTIAAEDLIATALARSSPSTGKIARSLALFVKKEKREDFTAKITGVAAGLSSLLAGKVKIEGNKQKAKDAMQHWFWHFWERTEQTQVNILRSKYRKA